MCFVVSHVRLGWLSWVGSSYTMLYPIELRLDQVRLDQVRLDQVRLAKAGLGQVRVRSG